MISLLVTDNYRHYRRLVDCTEKKRKLNWIKIQWKSQTTQETVRFVGLFCLKEKTSPDQEKCWTVLLGKVNPAVNQAPQKTDLSVPFAELVRVWLCVSVSQRGYRESLTLLAASTSQRRKQIKAIISGNNSAFSVLTPSQFPRQGVSSGCSIRRSLERGFLFGKSFPSPLWRSFVRFAILGLSFSVKYIFIGFLVRFDSWLPSFPLVEGEKKSRVVQQFFFLLSM